MDSTAFQAVVSAAATTALAHINQGTNGGGNGNGTGSSNHGDLHGHPKIALTKISQIQNRSHLMVEEES